MPEPPPCARLGQHCSELDVTLRIAGLEEDTVSVQDATATWLLGHTERITFGSPYVDHGEMLVNATVHVPCKHLRSGVEGNGRMQCAVFGYRGKAPTSNQSAPDERPKFARGGDHHLVSFKQRRRVLDLPFKKSARRALPIMTEDNPCHSAPCRTADNKQGAACCRDLTLDVVAPRHDRNLELLLRARRSPYLCKVHRTNDETIECEMISACGYLDPRDGMSCVLHGRLLPNGRSAKPSICWEWPDIGPDEVTHPGCRMA